MWVLGVPSNRAQNGKLPNWDSSTLIALSAKLDSVSAAEAALPDTSIREPSVNAGVNAAEPVRLTAGALRQWGLACVVPPGSLPDERVNGLAFSDSGRLLVSTHNDGTLRIINGATGEPDGVLRVKEYGCKLVTATHHEACFLHAANTKPVDDRVGYVAYHSLHDNSIVRYFKAHTQR